MSRKELQKNAVTSAFNRSGKNDWEIIATEQFEENELLTKKINDLEYELKNNQDIISIDPKKCCNWRFADRNEFELGDIDGLAEDIKTNGQLQPAIIRKINNLDFEYEVIGGERRWRACKLAGIDLKAILIDKDDLECMAIQTSENKKQSLSPYSVAKVYLKMIEELGISQNDLSKRLGIPKSSFGDLMAFNKIPQKIWDVVSDMTLVSPATAAFLSKTCALGAAHCEAVISVSSKIREGAGADTLRKLIDKILQNSRTNRNDTMVFENEHGEVLFRLTSTGRISISKSILNELDMNELGWNLKSYICEKI